MRKGLMGLLAVLISVSAIAQQSKTAIRLISETDNAVTFQLDVNQFQLRDVNTPKGKQKVLHSADATPLLLKGAPDLVKYATSIQIPFGADVEVVVKSYQVKTYSNFEIAPSKGNLTRDINPDNVDYQWGKVYNQNAFFPGKLADLKQDYVLRDLRGQVVHLYPFQYNPVTKQLKVYSQMVVELKTKGGSLNSQKQVKVNQVFNSIYQRQFLNYNSTRYTPVADYGNMLVIAKSEYLGSMQPFVDWKNQSGIPTEIVDLATVGSTATAIKSYVANYYNTNGLTYLLLVGDAADLPTNNLSSGHSDNAYAYISGNDHYPELFVGRFSAENNNHVITQVQRVLDYEKNPLLNNSGYGEAIGISSLEGPGDDNEHDYDHIRNMHTDLMGFTYDIEYEFFDGSQGGLDANGDPTAAMVAAQINNDAGIILYTGHGSASSFVSSGFNNSNINALTNTDVLPFIWSVACVNGDFVSNTCFAEHWMRATHNGQPSGAVATLMSTINQSWNPPMCAQDEMVDILTGNSATNNNAKSFGAISMSGCMQMIDEYSAGGESMTDTWTLFGDPSLLLRTDTPGVITAQHNPTVFLGASSFSLTSPNNGARATISLNNEILDTDIISGGNITLNFPAVTNMDTLLLVITQFNYKPYIAEIPIIASSGPYVVYSNNQIQDATGNNNSLLDFGETVDLNVMLENIGVDSAKAVNVTLRTNDSHITLIDSTHAWGDIKEGTIAQKNNAFTFSVNNSISDQHSVSFQLVITDNASNTWNSGFSIPVNAPAFAALDMVIDDSNGNNDSRVDAGETIFVKIPLKNTGHAKAASLYSELSENCTSVNILTNIHNHQNIAANGVDTAVFKLEIDAAIPNGTSFIISLNSNYLSYATQRDYIIQVGNVDEDFETGDLNKYNWQATGMYPWAISNDATFNGTYCAKSADINDGQSSMLKINIDVLADDTISFWLKTSCEEGSSYGSWWDYLEFKMGNQIMGQWDGQTNWTKVSYPIAAGQHQLKWIYQKDAYASEHDDCAWIDFVEFPPLSTVAGINTPDNRKFEASLYPNPANNKLNVEIQLTEASDIQMTIFNIQGKQLQAHQSYKASRGVVKQELNIQSLAPGIYFLKIQNGNSFKTYRFIKQ